MNYVGKNPSGGRPQTEYYVTFDVAKNIAMISLTPQGQKVREYFIDIEKQWRAEKIDSLYNDPAYLMAKALIAADKMINESEKMIALLTPKADAFDTFMAGINSQSMNDVAKILGIGRNTLFELLRKNGILMSNNVPYQRCMKYFDVVERPIEMGDADGDILASGLYLSKLLLAMGRKRLNS